VRCRFDDRPARLRLAGLCVVLLDSWVSSDRLGRVLLDEEPSRRSLDEQEGPSGQFRYRTSPPDFRERIARLFEAPAAPPR
jgi:hypothetical protein